MTNVYRIVPILLLAFYVEKCDPLRILGLFAFQGKSHFIMPERVMKGLADRGHHVDVVSHFPQKHPIPRYTDLSIRGSMPMVVNNMSFEMARTLTAWGTQRFVINEAGIVLCDVVLQHPVMQELKTSTAKYDAIVIEVFAADCVLAFVHLFDAPSIGVTTSVMVPWANDRFGNPDNPAYIPNYLLQYTPEMTFFERVVNTIVLVVQKIIFHYYVVLPQDKLARQYVNPEMPPLDQLINNMSLMLVNSHFSLMGARPLSPNVIEVGGVHIDPPKKLNEKLERIMVDGSSTGVIYFSMGSLVKTHTLPKDRLEMLMGAFARLPYTILWKGVREEFPEPIPENIVFEQWLPQIDILCHNNTKLFITHGGLMGTQEALYCATPLLGIPLFADQVLNMRMYASRGMAKILDLDVATRDDIIGHVTEIIGDASYKRNAAKLSSLYRDRPTSALDSAIYWIEYVARHGGAPHLKPRSASMPWYELHLVDVAVFVAVVLWTAWRIARACACAIYARFGSRKLKAH